MITKSSGTIPRKFIDDVIETGASFLAMSFNSGSTRPYVLGEALLRPSEQSMARMPLFFAFPNEAEWTKPIIDAIERVNIQHYGNELTHSINQFLDD